MEWWSDGIPSRHSNTPSLRYSSLLIASPRLNSRATLG